MAAHWPSAHLTEQFGREGIAKFRREGPGD
jgi:hypothetical protein